MSAIAWWLIPLLATLAAIVWVSWRSRPRPPEDTHEAIEAREKFRRAMEEPRTRRRGAGPSRSADSRSDGDD
jgi:hypothetical protein